MKNFLDRVWLRVRLRDPDLIYPERCDPDPVNIRPDPKLCNTKLYSYLVMDWSPVEPMVNGNTKLHPLVRVTARHILKQSNEL